MPIREINAPFPVPTAFPQIAKLVNQGTGQPFVQYEINNAHSDPIATSGQQSAYLGRITFTLSGILNVYMTGHYQFYGTIGVVDDLFDFNAETSSHKRTRFGELTVTVARQLDGKAFDYGNDLMNLFDRVQNGGGFNLRQQQDKGNAGFDSRGRPAVYIKPVSTSGGERQIDNIQTNYAGTALNEIMHLSRNSGFYDDPVMARALFTLLTPDERKANPLPNGRDASSRYWHPLFLKHCQP